MAARSGEMLPARNEGIAMVFWMAMWKAVFLVTVTGFALLSVWVTIQGARDIGFLMRTLRARHDEGVQREPE